MKLTKISIPVLMLMMFQSGHGMNAWFDQALSLFDKGQTAQAIQVINKNEPSLIKVTNSALVSNEVKEGIQEGSADNILAVVKDFVPREWSKDEDTTFSEVVTDAILGLEDISAANVKDALKDKIIENFYAACWSVDDDIVEAVNQWKTGVVEDWSTAKEAQGATPDSILAAVKTAVQEDVSGITVDDNANFSAFVEAIEEATDDAREAAAEDVLIDYLAGKVLTAIGEDEADSETAVKNFLKVYWWRDTDASEASATAVDDFLAKIGNDATEDDVKNAATYVVGTSLENWLRHSAADTSAAAIARQKDLINAIDALDPAAENYETDKINAVTGSIETFDDATVSQIVSWLNNKNAFGDDRA